MQARFENSFVRDKDTAKEIYQYWFFKKPTMVAMYAILAFYSLACIVGLCFDFENAEEFMPPCVLAVFLPVMMIISYRSQVKMMVKRDREMANGRELVCNVTVTDGEITFSALDGKNSVSLENLKYAFQTKSYIVVVTNAKLMYLLKNDGFTVGNAEEFIVFLKEKGVKIKGKKK